MTSPARKRSRLEGDVHSPSVDMSTMKRTRSDSRADLNEIYRLLRRTILTYQVCEIISIAPSVSKLIHKLNDMIMSPNVYEYM